MNKKIYSYSWRPSFSIAVSIGWLIFLITWFAFYAGKIPIVKNIAVIFLSILILVLLLGITWASWAIKMIPKPGRQIFKILGFRWRIYASMFIPIIGLIALIIWFWFFALPFNFWQNLAMFMIIILIIGGLLGVIWTRWGMIHEKDFEKFGKEISEIGSEIEK